MRDSDLPNLFIIGAPKCGTTSMFRLLSAHPEICASNPKETYFFADRELDHLNIRPNHRRNDLSAYLSLFGQVDDSTHVKMEASTHYLYSGPALNFISGMSPMPRLILQLRNPATRIWSRFNYIKHQAVAPIHVSIREYVDVLLSAQKKSTKKFTDESWPQHLLENQLSYSNYLEHLLPWLDRMPRENIEILILENMRWHARRSIQNIADWISVDPSYYDDYNFETANVTRSRSFKRIRRQVRHISRFLPKSVTSPIKQIVDGFLAPFLKRATAADKTALARLEDFFVAPNQRLQEEFDLDLSKWCRKDNSGEFRADYR